MSRICDANGKPCHDIVTTSTFLQLPESNNILFMTTAEDEQYQCLLPDESPNEFTDSVHYTGPSARALLQPLLDKHACTMRLETYWNYELCHGQHVRQFHESKTQGTQTKLQEFFLGRDYKYPTDPKFALQNATLIIDSRENLKVPTFYLREKEYSYFEVIMGNGTPCDLKEATPRLTRVHYICEEGSRNEMILQEESSTCEYRVVIATNILCTHPLYKTKVTPINTINCHPVNGAPSKPDALRNLENGNARKVKVTAGSTFPAHQTASTSEATSQVPHATTPPTKTVPPTHPAHIVDEELAQQFLRGEHCLTGVSNTHVCCTLHLVVTHATTPPTKTIPPTNPAHIVDEELAQ
ncbi:putative endoplasmic reticulum lectin 1 isoform X1 [Apostichopus japonicus]|uniref:Endoplasmic reticulum lectin 1 n=1 Tax=Stichopus japonicus TaxID=307972 RepID=A0A2G8L3B3_STIJA|nr:putative endoplasmic reticulum lectin 1 isoform X1 [Apostichopus japonicus]